MVLSYIDKSHGHSRQAVQATIHRSETFKNGPPIIALEGHPIGPMLFLYLSCMVEDATPEEAELLKEFVKYLQQVTGTA